MQSLTVASFNIHWGRHPRSNEPFDVVDVCRRLDADVVALQEVWRRDGEPSIAEDVARALGYDVHQAWTGRAVVEPKSRFVGRTGVPAGKGDWGQALLTRIPHGPVTEHRLDGFVADPSDRAVLTTEVDLDGAPVTVCASHFPHLEHISPLLRWRLRGVLPGLDQPAVLMGDFNMWRWVARFIAPGWRSTARGRTWPARLPLFQIDHILTTPPLTATDAAILHAGASDHLPLRANLAFRVRGGGRGRVRR